MLEFDLLVDQERREQSEPKSELDLEFGDDWFMGLEKDWELGEKDAIGGQPSRNLNFAYNAGFCHATFSPSNLEF